MQNENNTTVPQNPEGQSAEQKPVTDQLKETAKAEVQNVAENAQQQMSNVGKEATQQMQNLGQAGVNQVQNLGQAGVAQVGNLVGQMMASKEDLKNQPAVSKDEKVYATISYVPFVALVSIVVKPDSAYVRLHAKQGLLLAILFFFVGMMAAIVSLFGLIGQLLAFLLGLVPLATMVIGVYSMYLAASGYWWKIPVLSSVADLIPVEMMAKASKENITGQVGVAKNDYDNREDTLKQEKMDNSSVQSVQQPPVQGQQNIANANSTGVDSTPKA